VIEHLSAQVKPNPSGELCYFCCQNISCTPPLGTSDTLTIIKNGLEMRKMATKVKRVKNSNKQTTKHYKASSKTSQKFFGCCFVVIRVQK